VKIAHIVGARPNFMKVAPVMNALAQRENINQNLIHTGQHYDVNMSDVFFQQLGMADPDVNLAVGSGTHAAQTAEIMLRLEPVIAELQPDVVLVYGDVNSTVATALVCAKLGIKIGHVEAGLRSFDRSMPEEVNRLVTDQLAELLFTPSEDGDANLRREGIPGEKIFRVGNVMIDSLVRLLPAASSPRAYRRGMLSLRCTGPRTSTTACG
jgi:UDP-N-acetylglucosamine 2-epimerase (non-hydrolysing)